MSGIIVDLIFLAVLAIFAVVGMFRGFFSTLLSLLGFVGAILIAWLFREQTVVILDSLFDLTNWLNNVVGENIASVLAPAIAIIVAFVLLKIIVFILEHTLGKLFKGGLVGKINSVLGLILGFVKGVLFSIALFAIVCVLTLIPSVKTFVDNTIQGTYVVSWVYNIVNEQISNSFGNDENEKGDNSNEENGESGDEENSNQGNMGNEGVVA